LKKCMPTKRSGRWVTAASWVIEIDEVLARNCYLTPIPPFDRGAKFAAYRKLPSLSEYLLIDSERLSADLFRRDETGRWVLYPFDTAAQQVELASVGMQLPLQVLYEDVRLEKSASAHP